MENYINMNDSFGGKNSQSSTKTYISSYEQCIQSLKQTLHNHKNALSMAQQLVDQYRQQNQHLNQQIDLLKQGKLRADQKYEILEQLFIKLNKQKEKQAKKQTKRSQQQYYVELEIINSKYQSYMANLKERVYLLQRQVVKYQQKQKKYHHILRIQPSQNSKNYFTELAKGRQNYSTSNRQKQNYELNKIEKSRSSCETIKNQDKDKKSRILSGLKNPTVEGITLQQFNHPSENQIFNSRVTLGKKDPRLTKRDKKFQNKIQYMRCGTECVYQNDKQQIVKTAQKNKKLITYRELFERMKLDI